MKKYLETSDFGLTNVYTHYDKPGPQFSGRLTDPMVKTQLESRLIKEGHLRRPFADYDHIIVSSTSWTKDENFSLVLDSCPKWSTALGTQKALLFITGKGELRDQFVADFKKIELHNIDLSTAWLSPGDYPLILACATAGISVHTSTSGLDLPMKAVDMLGSECPVLALHFPALDELLGSDGGLTFTTSQELADCLISVTCGPSATETVARFQKFASQWRKQTWKSEWTLNVWPVINSLLPRQSRQSKRRLKRAANNS
jgi:beta-1,4-mannosyltransferase